jgi:hypothetical protein
MFVVDTNVLVYAANTAAPEHGACRTQLEEWRRNRLPWCTTWGVLYEFLRVVTHPRVFAEPWPALEAWQFVSALLASSGLQVLVETPRHGDVVRQVVQEVPGLAGNLLHDVHTASLMREHGIRRIYTRDMDFHRFPFLEVVDPLAAR